MQLEKEPAADRLLLEESGPGLPLASRSLSSCASPKALVVSFPGVTIRLDARCVERRAALAGERALMSRRFIVNMLLRDSLNRNLTPTELPGVFLSEALPAGFDPSTATEAAMNKHGLFWRKPTQGDDPVLFDAWSHHLARGWSGAKRIEPHFVVQHGKVHRPRRGQVPGHLTNEITNWGGGAVFGVWTSASGAWKVPTVSRPAEAPGKDGGWDSSSWVGLDGSGSNDVLQAGVEQAVDSNGRASYVAWYEWFCNYQKRTLADTSPFSPSLASLNGRMYIAWRGDGNNNLNVMMSVDDGQTFGSKTVSPETSDDAPALATDGSTLYIAWKGHGNDNLNVATVALDGPSGAPIGLINKVILSDTSPVRPTLAVLNGNLYLGWKGDGNDNLNVMVSTNQGRSFGAKLVSEETSPQAPALAAHNGGLFVSWKGDGNDNLNVAQVTLGGANPTGFSNKVTLADTSPKSPALVSFNGVLYLGWKGDGNDNLNIMQSTNNGTTFGGKYTSPETSPEAPCLVAQNGHMFIGWKGDGNDNLNVSLVGIDRSSTITGFTTPEYVFEVQIPNFHVNPGDSVHCSVQYISGNTLGQISFGNSTNGENFQITIVPPPGAAVSGNSAEWIMEVPTIGGSYSHMPSFTPVDFSGAVSCGANVVGNPQNGSTFVVYNDNGQPLTATTLGNATVDITYV
jgi:hypothetical protein